MSRLSKKENDIGKCRKECVPLLISGPSLPAGSPGRPRRNRTIVTVDDRWC